MIIAIQVQERSRGCNVAQHGGSTEICTETQTESRSCNEDCSKLNHLSGLTLTPKYSAKEFLPANFSIKSFKKFIQFKYLKRLKRPFLA